MAVVDEYYSSRLELGPPAMVAYMASFMGERERMNRAIIDDMLKTADPKALAERERDARKQLNDLLKLKQQAQIAGGKANTDIIKAILQYRAAERGAQARESAAITAARGAFAKSQMYQEGRKQEAIAAGRDAAAKGSDTATAPASQTYATTDAQVNEYRTALTSARAAVGVGAGNLVGFGGKAAELKLAEDAFAAATKAGHTAAAAWIKQTYFDNKDPSTFYQESDFRPKTEEEMLQTAARIPTGGKGGLAQVVQRLEGDLSMDPGTVGKLVYGTVKVNGKTLEETYGPPTQDALDTAGAAAVVSGSSPAGAGTPDIDAAIADVKAQIEQMQAQRGKRPSLQEIAASRYPNYLYTNPFQVRSTKFDTFQRDLERLSPRAQQRYLEAAERAPSVFSDYFMRKDFERTEPAEIPTEGFRFQEEGVDTSKPGEMVVSKVADLLEKTQSALEGPQTVGDRGDTVEFVTRDGKPAVKITENTPEKKVVYAPKGSKTYETLKQQFVEKAPETSNLKAYMDTLPDSVGERELAPVYAALTKGGYAAAAAEARKLAEKGDVGLHEIYARELQDISREPDAVKRNDRLEALRGKVPEGVSWKKALDRVLDASTIETATEGARGLSDALREAFPTGIAAEIRGEEPTRFETRGAQERAKAREEPTKEQREAGLKLLPANIRAKYEAERAAEPVLPEEGSIPSVESVIGLPPGKLAPKKEREAYEKKRADLDTLRKNNKQAYLDLVHEERATRGAKAPGELVQGAEHGTLQTRPTPKSELRTLTPTEAGALGARQRTAVLAAAPKFDLNPSGFLASNVRQALPPKVLPEQEDLWADLSASMLGVDGQPLVEAPVPKPTPLPALRDGRSLERVSLSEDRSAAVQRSADEQAAYKARQQPGRSGLAPTPWAAPTDTDRAAANALVENMPVPAKASPAKASPAKAAPAKPTGSGTMGDSREKKTPPPAAKKKSTAEEDAAEL